MTDSSDDSADTVISVLDSRLSQSLSTSDSLSPEDLPSQITDNEKPQKSDVMGNRHGGEKKKRKEDLPQEKKPEDKPKKKGKKSKGKSKRNSQNVEGDLSSGQGACASPSSSTAKEKSRSRSKRPDVLADLGTKTTGSPLGSPESASGSQGTWSYDDESDVSTLGYSTPLLSTPQVQRYVLPKQTTPQQSSTERLEELGRSIEKTIVDKLSDRPTEEGATSALATRSSSDRKERRNVKKKRALGQAVIDSDSFTLPLQDVKSVQSERRSPQTQRLNTGTEKISLRASQESPVSPWLRDDDTPVDEEQMDEMFISCIDLSYNLADICSEKEFTEYGSLDSKKHAKGEKGRVKETSLSPRIARKANESNVSPWAKELSRIKNADSRETPPKSDSSTSTLAEAGCDRVQENDNTDLCKQDVTQRAAGTQEKATEDELQSVKPQLTHDSKESFSEDKDPSSVDKQPKVKKKTGKSKSKPKKKIKDNIAPIATNDSDIPTGSDSPKHTRAISGDKEKTDSVICDKAQHSKSDADNMLRKEGESCLDDLQQCVVDKNKKINSEDVSETFSPGRETVMDEAKQYAVDAIDRNITEEGRSNESSCEIETGNEKVNQDDCVPTKNILPETDSKRFDPVPDSAPREYQVMAQAECLKNNGQTGSSQEPLQNVPKATESLSPQEPASPKHVPPPSPSSMDALAEIDEDDEEALEALEENSQLKEVQLFGETVFKRLSSLVESQSQDEDIEDRFNDFRDSDELPRGGTDSPPVNLGSMALLNGDVNGIPDPKASDVSEREGQEANKFQEEVVEEAVVAGSSLYVEKTNVEKFPEHHENISNRDTLEGGSKDDNDVDIVDEGTLKRKKKKSGQKKGKKDQEKEKKDPHGNVVKKPEIPMELKQARGTEGATSKDQKSEKSKIKDEWEKENSPPKRESQQIQEVIDAYGLGDIVDVCVEKLPSDRVKQGGYVDVRPRYESDDDEEDDDSDSSCNSRSRSSGRPSTSSLELSSRRIPDIEETFNELLSVKHILEDFEDRTPTDERLPSFVSSDELRSPPECVNGRRSRMSPAVTDRTESDLDISEQRDDISTDSMYADDEDDGASEVLFSRSYSEPDGNEVVVSCTFYNTQHNNNNAAVDSDDFWEDYSTADESFKQIEISADAASSTFQNARKQMHDIHQHLQDLRRQMEYLQEEVESATLTPEYSMDSEDKRHITE